MIGSRWTTGRFAVGAALLAGSGCVVAIDETITVRQPVDAIVISVTAGDVTIDAAEGDVELSGDFGGPGRGTIGHELVDGVLTIDYDCKLCGGKLSISCPPETGITADVGGGDLTLNGMAGSVNASLGGGTTKIRGHGAGNVTLDADVGDAELEFLASPERIDVSVGTGTIGIDVPIGAYALDLDATNGFVDVSGVTDDPGAPYAIVAYAGTGSIAIQGN